MHQLLGEPGDEGLGKVRTHLDQAYQAAMTVTDPALLELCTMRMAMLLGHPLAQEAPEHLSTWPTNGNYDPTQQACLAFAEEFVVDVASLSDKTAFAVRDAMGGPGQGDVGLATFANALLAMEQRLRLELIWKAVL